jgi:hypothetical protein
MLENHKTTSHQHSSNAPCAHERSVCTSFARLHLLTGAPALLLPLLLLLLLLLS